MRKTSYISKKLSDSVLGLALLTAPITLPQPSIDEVSDSASFEAPSKKSVLGRFLETEIEGRIERVSGKPMTTSERKKRSHEIAIAIAEASYVYNVDPFLILSMIEVESRYNAAAVGLHGEKGLMQIKPSTARWISPVTDELHDCDLHQVRCNLMMGASYVSHLQQKVEKRRGQSEEGGLELSTPVLFREHVLRSYNLGPAKANRLANERTPASETAEETAATDTEMPEVVPYATKIGKKADRMRSRYLTLAMNH